MKIKEIITELVDFAKENDFEIEVVNKVDQDNDIKKITIDLSGKLIFE